ncbi:MAG: hypothetical protein ACRCSL_11300 [Microbacterium sp.]
MIGPAEMPPVVFGSDCAKVLSADELSEVVGADLGPGDRDSAYDVTANAGGLSCEWTGPNGEWVFVDVIPQAGLGGTEIPADAAAFYFDECKWAGGSCSWQGGDDSVWLGISFSGITGIAHDAAVGWGDDLGKRILVNHAAAAAEPWTRDRTGWWPTLDCATIAEALGAQLGATLVGEPYGYEDLPSPGALLVDEATGRSDCALHGADGEHVVRVVTSPGLGAVFSVPDAEPVDSGVPGISMLDYGADIYGGAQSFRVTDGVNRVDMGASGSTLGTAQEIATAVAAAAASDFQ